MTRASDRDRDRAVALLRARAPIASVALPHSGTVIVGRARGCDVVLEA